MMLTTSQIDILNERGLNFVLVGIKEQYEDKSKNSKLFHPQKFLKFVHEAYYAIQRLAEEKH